MSKELVINYRDVFRSIALHLNALNASITGKVDSLTFNNSVNNFQNTLSTFETKIVNFEAEFELLEGMHFENDQANQKILLKNSQGQIITDVNVGWLNNEGTVISYNATTNNLELKNSQGELLSVIPVGSFVSNIGSHLSFNNINKFILELKDNSGTLTSSVEINIENVKNLQSTLNQIQTIYNNNGTVNNNREISLNDKYLKFITTGDVFEINENKLIIPNLYTNKFGISHEANIITTNLNSNLPYMNFGNGSIERVTHLSKNHTFKNVKLNDGTGNKMLILNDNGDMMFTNGLSQSYVAGPGITITGNIISLTPADSVELVFEW